MSEQISRSSRSSELRPSRNMKNLVFSVGMLLCLRIQCCQSLSTTSINSTKFWTRKFPIAKTRWAAVLPHSLRNTVARIRRVGGSARETFSHSSTEANLSAKKILPIEATLHKNRAVSIFQLCSVVLMILTCFACPAWAATNPTNKPVTLGVRNLLASSLMLTTLAALPLSRMGAASLARLLVVSASRCAIQVFLLGSVVLQRMMSTSHPIYVLLWIFGVGLIAGKEAFSRIQYSYPSMQRHVSLSVLTGGFTVLGLTLALNVLGNVEPWFQPRTWIPVAGMLFGNTLSATALGASTITKQFATNHDQVELRLARGATSTEAILPLIQDTFLTALTPTINGLAVTGIVHIPGMMTGQILAGQSPPQAAAYQVMITFLIATTACATVQLLVNSVVGALVDSRNHRLRANMLSLKDSSTASTSGSLNPVSAVRRTFTSLLVGRQDSAEKEEALITTEAMSSGAPPAKISPKTMLSTKQQEKQLILEAKDLHVVRANADVTFLARKGDRIGLSGRSGVGKSQLLRTIAGLEETTSGGELYLNGTSSSQIHAPEFRAKVCLVPQDKPTLEGTPRMFYEEIRRFTSQRRAGTEHTQQNPIDIARKWGLKDNTFDQQWSTLSSGEAQRVSLAIALSLQPSVLLLDESTSALDEATCKLVEESLVESNIPIVAVTHSTEQLNRFCTHIMNLT